jgi:hypothetical protein
MDQSNPNKNLWKVIKLENNDILFIQHRPKYHRILKKDFKTHDIQHYYRYQVIDVRKNTPSTPLATNQFMMQ